MRKEYWTTGSGEIELLITEWHTDNQPQCGDCLSSVKEALPFEDGENQSIESQLSEYDDNLIIEQAIEYGCKDYGSEGTPTKQEAYEFITWIAISDVMEEFQD